MGKKLYVGNLTYAVTSSDLEGWFAQYGTVQSAQVIQDRDTGRSKGFGFVEMDTEAEAHFDHERQAAHLRALAEAAPTGAVKQHLLTQAEEHERLARLKPS